MVLGLLLGIMGAWTIAEGVHVIRGGMSSGEESKFDAKNGSRGIDPTDVVKIAQRNGVYPNKDGVLPEKPNSRIMDYVRQYANSSADVREFERQWCLTVKKQLDKKHSKIRNENKDEYNSLKNYYQTAVIPFLGDEVIYLEINHWTFMPRNIHEQRMRDIVDNTVFGKFVRSYALRVNPRVGVESYIEYYELRLPKSGVMSHFEFKKLYKLCCGYLGYDHMM